MGKFKPNLRDAPLADPPLAERLTHEAEGSGQVDLGAGEDGPVERQVNHPLQPRKGTLLL